MSGTTTNQSVITLSAIIRVVAPSENARANGCSFKLRDIIEVDGVRCESQQFGGTTDNGKSFAVCNISVMPDDGVGTIADAVALEPIVFVKRKADAEEVVASGKII